MTRDMARISTNAFEKQRHVLAGPGGESSPGTPRVLRRLGRTGSPGRTRADLARQHHRAHPPEDRQLDRDSAKASGTIATPLRVTDASLGERVRIVPAESPQRPSRAPPCECY